MSKMIIVFLIIFLSVWVAIEGFTAASGREKLQIAKVLGYSLTCATLAILIIASIVILF